MKILQGPAELFWDKGTLMHIRSGRTILEGVSLDEAGSTYPGMLITVVLGSRSRNI